uniref:Uncharacterized protein n=1 Tax=Arcella intermedia TaxID=1963864 RepID=A0A6B2LHB1_9EUKA
MYYRSMRYPYYQLALKCGAAFLIVFLKVSLETALRNNSNRVGHLKVPHHIIQLMDNKLEIPGDRYHWERDHCIAIQNDHFEASLLDWKDILTKFWKTPVQEGMDAMTLLLQKEKDKEITSKNVIHNLDLALRKMVSSQLSQLKGLPAQELSSLAKQFSIQKATFLKDFQHGKISIIPPESDTSVLDSSFIINQAARIFQQTLSELLWFSRQSLHS